MADFTETLWHASAERNFESSRAHGELKVDVAVVGGGITGMTAALLLQRQGRTVVVLERGKLGMGTTGGTTAHLTTEFDAGFAFVRERFGAEAARCLAEALCAARNRVRELASELAIACEYRELPGYYFAETKDSDKDVLDEFEAAREAGLEVELLDSCPLPFARGRAFRLRRQAQFHPLRYLHGLAREFLRRGGRIFEDSPVVSFKADSQVELVLPDARVVGRQAVFATHTPIGRDVLHPILTPWRSYVLAAEVPAAIPDGLFWDTEEPYHYIRAIDGMERVLLVGGADTKVGHGGEREAYASLRKYLQERFPGARELRAWSAQLYVPADGLPLIGHIPFLDNCFTATGFSGDGMTCGTLGGWILADQILKRGNPYAKLFATRRMSFLRSRETFARNLDVAMHFVEDRLRLPGRAALEMLPRGEGCLIRNPDGHRVAAYRADDGSLHERDALCPHMKCIVQWNAAERTWDCPCHGSRFLPSGANVEGPSLDGLAPLETKET